MKWILLITIFLSGCSNTNVKSGDDGTKSIVINIAEGVIILDDKTAERVLSHIRLYPPNVIPQTKDKVPDSQRFFPDTKDNFI